MSGEKLAMTSVALFRTQEALIVGKVLGVSER